ncbi:MAG: HEPN domain-containing protein [Rhodospirillaceae bacterium]|jgi:hypothetical protein|nr:HEPN domain-containing protein [Rhodospirillaceae bacterium]MBT3886904.1 HEPN domain-containing protein [Rhodospirillaceae bacterium]MBT4115612.1 HEPN domain-containing protein [Rhodospirillaceae bacterium]MBT4719786.1 HEPN domain-containing protein [Rhodospirillaceae bacterium]MBT4748357.1 HEPN domain-containing protein [Rhodospirillaceae bacterium]
MQQSRLEVAERLFAGAQEESEFRTVASTSYMAAFQHVLNHPRCSEFKITKTGEDHRLLFEYLKLSTDAGMRRLGHNYLTRLRALRNKADYTMDIPFTRGEAEEALERATEVIYEFLP